MGAKNFLTLIQVNFEISPDLWETFHRESRCYFFAEYFGKDSHLKYEQSHIVEEYPEAENLKEQDIFECTHVHKIDSIDFLVERGYLLDLWILIKD